VVVVVVVVVVLVRTTTRLYHIVNELQARTWLY